MDLVPSGWDVHLGSIYYMHCSVIAGDSPINITWYRDGQPIRVRRVTRRLVRHWGHEYDRKIRYPRQAIWSLYGQSVLSGSREHGQGASDSSRNRFSRQLSGSSDTWSQFSITPVSTSDISGSSLMSHNSLFTEMPKRAESNEGFVINGIPNYQFHYSNTNENEGSNRNMDEFEDNHQFITLSSDEVVDIPANPLPVFHTHSDGRKDVHHDLPYAKARNGQSSVLESSVTESPAVQQQVRVEIQPSPNPFANGESGDPDHLISINVLSDRVSSLMFQRLTSQHSGNYTCRAQNQAGVASLSKIVDVKGAWYEKPHSDF